MGGMLVPDDEVQEIGHLTAQGEGAHVSHSPFLKLLMGILLASLVDSEAS